VKLRQRGHALPIIVVTGSCNKAEVVRVLDAGANDGSVAKFSVGPRSICEKVR